MITRDTYTHRFHPYPAKFPAYAIRDLILDYSNENDWVLDPFCGSGTTLVECRLQNRNAIGIELNPVGKLISESKSAYYIDDDIILIKKAIEKIKNDSFFYKEWISSHSSDVKILENHPNKEFWFEPHVINELHSIKSSINDFYTNRKVHDLLLTAFSRIIVPVSNQDSETRYKSVIKGIKPGDALKLYIKTVNKYVEVLEINMGSVSTKVYTKTIEGDTTKKIKLFEPESFDLVITSPPYINSFDYYLYHKHRIFWLGKDPKIIRNHEIGNHHKIDSKSYDNAVSDYKQNIGNVFNDIERVLKKGRFFIIFIGDGIVKKRIVDAKELIIDIVKKTNLKVIEINSTPLRQVSKGFIKGDNLKRKNQYIIIMKKTEERGDNAKAESVNLSQTSKMEIYSKIHFK